MFPAFSELWGRCIHHFRKFSHGPKRIADIGGHRGRQAIEALVLFYVVVPNRVDRNHVHVVFEFLRKCISEASKSAHLHPHSKVLAFGI